jgi:hypothetical protein
MAKLNRLKSLKKDLPIAFWEQKEAALRIHDILVCIRIRIRGSMPLTNGSGSGFGIGTCYFHLWPSRRQQKSKKKSFSAYFLKVRLHHFSKIKSQKEVTKQRKSRFFLKFLLNDRRIRIQEAQIHVDPVDPDPESDPQH